MGSTDFRKAVLESSMHVDSIPLHLCLGGFSSATSEAMEDRLVMSSIQELIFLVISLKQFWSRKYYGTGGCTGIWQLYARYNTMY